MLKTTKMFLLNMDESTGDGDSFMCLNNSIMTINVRIIRLQYEPKILLISVSQFVTYALNDAAARCIISIIKKAIFVQMFQQ